MLADAPPTPFDLRFTLFGFPVRVSPWFWLVMAVLGENILRVLGPKYLLVWVLCGFVAILVHELGHAVVVRRFGSPCQILLIAFGGLAVYPYPPAARWKRVMISLAGPGAGFALLAAVWGSSFAYPWPEAHPLLGAAYIFLIEMCLFWNLLNLLPIWPLDGGKVCRELCGAVRLRNPDVAAFAISTLTAGGLAVVGLLAKTRSLPPEVAAWLPFIPGVWMTIWFALFAYESYQLWQQATRTRPWDHGPDDDDTPPWKRR